MTKKSRDFRKGLHQAKRLLNSEEFKEVQKDMMFDLMVFGETNIDNHLHKLLK